MESHFLKQRRVSGQLPQFPSTVRTSECQVKLDDKSEVAPQTLNGGQSFRGHLQGRWIF